MAGIKANSASKTMVDGDTAVDKSVSGYITSEAIILTVTGSPSTFAWSLSKPTGSSARADLSDTDEASISFVPDVEGIFLVNVTVDGVTSYVIRISCVNIGAVSFLGAIRFLPIANSQVPTPASGQTLFFSSDAGTLAVKRTDGTVHTITQS